MRTHRKTQELINWIIELSDDGRTNELPYDYFVALLVDKVGPDPRQVKPAMKYFIGKGAIYIDPKDAGKYVVFVPKALATLRGDISPSPPFSKGYTHPHTHRNTN